MRREAQKRDGGWLFGGGGLAKTQSREKTSLAAAAPRARKI